MLGYCELDLLRIGKQEWDVVNKCYINGEGHLLAGIFECCEYMENVCPHGWQLLPYYFAFEGANVVGSQNLVCKIYVTGDDQVAGNMLASIMVRKSCDDGLPTIAYT